MLSLLEMKIPRILIKNTGDVGAMTFEDRLLELICRSILFWISPGVDVVRIAHLPQACPGLFWPSHDGWDL